MKLLVIEDDRGLANGIAFSMERDGHEVFCTGTLKKGWELLEQKQPDAILLDLNLPDGDGLDFCRMLREKSQVPVIMLTARDMETDEVQGLLSGADDYLTKPFSLAVLKVRLDTVLRRSRAVQENISMMTEKSQMWDAGQMRQAEKTLPETGQTYAAGDCRMTGRDLVPEIVCGGIRLLPGMMKVYCNGEEIDCSATEYRLLYYLMENRGQVLLKEQILEHVWDSTGSFVDENTLQVTIRRLRKKLKDDSKDGGYIRTVRGMGYILCDMTPASIGTKSRRSET